MKTLFVLASMILLVSCAEETAVNDQITDSVTAVDTIIVINDADSAPVDSTVVD